MGNSESTIRKKLEGRPVVVVVGGGFAGIQVSKGLDRNFNVLLIDRKNYFFNNIGSLRASVVAGFLERIVVPYDRLLTFGNVIQAEVTEVRPDGVILNGRDVPVRFDYLILATGSTSSFPAKVAVAAAKDLPAFYQDSERAIQEASDILIIGGGPVGVELLGEILYKYPKKDVTIVHKEKDLISGNWSQKFKDEVLSRLKEFSGVEVILEDEVILDEETRAKFQNSHIKGKSLKFQTKNGIQIETDLAFFCGGSKVNNSPFLENFGTKLNEAGRLKVNQYLQVEGYENIFGIGDCAGNDPELAFMTKYQAAQVCNNIALLDQKKPLKEYKPPLPPMILPIGPKKGVAQLPITGGLVLGNSFVSTVMGETLLAPKYLSLLNHEIPKGWEDTRFENRIGEDKVQWLSNSAKISPEEAKKLLEGLDPIQN